MIELHALDSQDFRKTMETVQRIRIKSGGGDQDQIEVQQIVYIMSTMDRYFLAHYKEIKGFPLDVVEEKQLKIAARMLVRWKLVSTIEEIEFTHEELSINVDMAPVPYVWRQNPKVKFVSLATPEDIRDFNFRVKKNLQDYVDNSPKDGNHE